MEIGEAVSAGVAGDATSKDASATQPAQSLVLLWVVPRPAAQLFAKKPFSNATDDTAVTPDQITDRIPHWKPPSRALCPLDKEARIKAIEGRFQIDLATEVKPGQWLAQKKLTVLCFYRRPKGTYRPVANAAIELSCTTPNAELQFKLADGTFGAQLSGKDGPKTNDQGLAELTIAHPPKDVPMDSVTILAKTEVPKLSADGKSTTSEKVPLEFSLTVELVRNDQAAKVEELFGDPDQPDSADRIWVHQPHTPGLANDGISDLQEAINEVVSRHRGVDLGPSELAPLTGRFDDATRAVLAKYLKKFPAVHGSDYPYDLSKDGGVGPDKQILQCLKEDYAPFDPTSETNQGGVVDRRLLIGKKRDNSPKQIDGLWELYEGVVKVLQTQVRTYAQSYLDADTFWLHRPVHGPYQAGPDVVFVCVQAGARVMEKPDDTAAVVTTLNADDRVLVDQSATGGWLRLVLPSGFGWVREAQGKTHGNDAGRFRPPPLTAGPQERNVGTLGVAGGPDRVSTHNGVAYTYGGKQTPDEWKQTLTGNPGAAPDKIVNYDEYQKGFRFGERKAELDANDKDHCEAGVDCSGFVQNCIVHAAFPDGTRIVPKKLVGGPPVKDHAIAASQFIGAQAKARSIARPVDDLSKHWVRGGDIITTSGHIVMVAQDHPEMLDDQTDFLILHAWGSDKPTDFTQFRRKTIRSPFQWYKGQTSWSAFSFGKIFIWS